MTEITYSNVVSKFISGLMLDLDFASMTTLDPRVTYSRGGTGTIATYYDSAGVLRYAAHNYEWWSEDFTQGPWQKISSATVTGNAIAAPDGNTTADRLNHTVTGTFTGGGFSQTIAAHSGWKSVFSVYVKAGTKSLVMLGTTTTTLSTYAWFDLAAGVVGTKGAGLISSGMTDVGGGWYRCWIHFVTPNTAVWVRVAEVDNNINCTTTGDLYVWGAQYEDVTTATTPSTYCPTINAEYHGPRFDYDPVSHAPKGLLIEESRTNQAVASQDFSSGLWTKTGTTITVDNTTAPDGTVTADLVTASATPAVITQSLSVPTAGASYTQCVYAKKGTSDWFYLCSQITGTGAMTPKAYFNLATGAVGTIEAGITAATIQAVGNGWYRCTATAVATAGQEFWMAGICDADNSATATVSRTIYLWGGQFEQAVFASSYIPTGGSGSAGRSVDVAVMTGTNFSSWYNQPAGTFIVEFDLFSVATAFQGILSADNAATSNRIHFRIDSADPTFQVVSGNTLQGALDLGTIAKNTVSKIGGSYAVNDLAGCFNGGTVVTDTGAVVPTAAAQTQLRIGVDAASNYMSGHVRRIRYWNTAKSDAELITLTNVPVPSYANPGGTGDRTSSITVTTTATVVGPITNIVDGGFLADGNDGFFFAGDSGKEIKFDFGTSKTITEAKWYQNTSNTHGDWKWQGSNDNSAWTDIGASFTLGGATPSQTMTTLSGNAVAYRYYKLLQVSGTSSAGPWVQEIEFKLI